MIETVMSKQRIFEIYLNIIEWGNGVFGAEAAARYYFKHGAANLDAWEAARLAAMVPKPRYYDRNRDTPWLRTKTNLILGAYAFGAGALSTRRPSTQSARRKRSQDDRWTADMRCVVTLSSIVLVSRLRAFASRFSRYARAARHRRLHRSAARGSSARGSNAFVAQPFPAAHGEPPISAASRASRVTGLRRIGKRIVIELEGDLFLVLHLMIAGRLRWRTTGSKAAGPRSVWRCSNSRPARWCSPKPGPSGARRCTWCGARTALQAFDPGGLDVAERGPRCIRRAAQGREPHAEARADRPAHLQRHRQRLLGRDPASRAAVAGCADVPA